MVGGSTPSERTQLNSKPVATVVKLSLSTTRSIDHEALVNERRLPC